MKRIDAKTALANLESVATAGEVKRMCAALRRAPRGTEVVLGRVVASEILQGFRIRLRTTLDVDRRVPGFRALVESLERLNPDVVLHDYALLTEREVYRAFVREDVGIVVGSYFMNRTPADYGPEE